MVEEQLETLSRKPKLMIIGYGRHGKDTVCDLLAKRGYTFESSSMCAAKIFLYEKLKDKYGYKSFEECYEDRHNHRAEWYKEIKSYNTPDLGKLAKQIYSEFHIYCGIRDRDEFYSLKNDKAFDYALWVDASERLPPESKDSMNLTIEDADIVIDNNGLEVNLPFELNKVMRIIDLDWENL